MPRCTHNHEYLYSQSWLPPKPLYSTQVFKYSPVITWGPDAELWATSWVHLTSRSATTHRHTLNHETGYMLHVMQVLQMTDWNSRTKHVDLKIKWLQDHLQKGVIKIHHVPTSLNMADILTKALPRETFVRCIANALKPDDILPPIAQNEGECWENIWWILNTYSLYERICIDTHHILTSPL